MPMWCLYPPNARCILFGDKLLFPVNLLTFSFVLVGLWTQINKQKTPDKRCKYFVTKHTIRESRRQSWEGSKDCQMAKMEFSNFKYFSRKHTQRNLAHHEQPQAMQCKRVARVTFNSIFGVYHKKVKIVLGRITAVLRTGHVLLNGEGFLSCVRLNLTLVYHEMITRSFVHIVC